MNGVFSVVGFVTVRDCKTKATALHSPGPAPVFQTTSQSDSVSRGSTVTTSNIPPFLKPHDRHFAWQGA